MKLRWISDWDVYHKKGDEVEVDAIKFDAGYAGYYKVRVVNVWKTPRWLAISWFLKLDIEKFP